jgi:HEAT repeat protein
MIERMTKALLMLSLFSIGVLPAEDAEAITPYLDSLATVTLADYAAQVQQISPELKPLHDQLSDREAAVRMQAVQGLALAGGDEAALLLARAMSQTLEREPAVRMEAAKSLGELGGRRALEVLGIGLTDSEIGVRKQAIRELRWAGTVFAVPYIGISVQSDPSDAVRLEAVRMLRKIGTQFSVQWLSEAMFNDASLSIRRAAADAMGEVGKKEIQAADFLGRAYDNERDSGVRLELVSALGLVRNKAGLQHLERAMLDNDPAVRVRATQVYGRVLGLQ